MTAPLTNPGGADARDADDQLVADVFARGCGSRRTLENIAGKWGILALSALHEGAYRFNALRRRVDGVSEKMLSQTLQALERDGLVRRDVQTTIPPHVEYSLTPLGTRVAERLIGLIELVESELGTVLAAQAEYDRAADRNRRK
ncbi:transcriptional regulator, HxlR family [Micromonospora purpureochromogenes]|uniref:Transcriptional regulator, HxlR family n=1 Tax=Micromonospora purpureochromogenes TaxID=47872 RepID=A0A1C4ZNF3_9ACTN|nr:helix-turn-helix domain-containing protein [Micromonospora purpureochromogenes]SCF34590.1 transcriptional regulator, HxlR family [Micromonospora purpureochromogenes]